MSQNKKLIITVVLCIAAVISLFYGIVSPGKGARRRAKDKESGDAATSFVKLNRQAKKTTFTSWGRSPFVPTRLAGSSIESFMLNGIIYNKKNPKAIINNEIVKKGSKMGKTIVVEIKKNSVILNDGLEDFEIHLSE